jgi:hypothetical protein
MVFSLLLLGRMNRLVVGTSLNCPELHYTQNFLPSLDAPHSAC